MTASLVSANVRALVRSRANYRCEYCHTNERLSGIAGEIDHIVPVSGGGGSDPDNLCWACSSCNGRKWAKMEGIDPQTGQSEPLFNPRQQTWLEHFSWNDEGSRLIGKTACGRATIHALQMNNELIVAARRLWARFGLHPAR